MKAAVRRSFAIETHERGGFGLSTECHDGYRFPFAHVNLLYRLGETCGTRVHVHMYSINERKGFLVVEIYLHFSSMVGLCSRNQEYIGLSQSTRGCYHVRVLPRTRRKFAFLGALKPSEINGFSLYL